MTDTFGSLIVTYVNALNSFHECKITGNITPLKIKEWLDNNINGSYIWDTSILDATPLLWDKPIKNWASCSKILFESKDDATLFKLTFY